MLRTLQYFLILTVIMCACEGYSILVAFPMPAKSHGILGNAVVRTLLEAGHEVTYMTPFPLDISNTRLRLVNVSFAHDILWANNPLSLRNKIDNKGDKDDPNVFIEIINNLNYAIVANKEVSAFLSDPEHQFDVVLVEWLFSEFLNGLSAVFNCPYIWLSSMDPHWGVLRLIDETTNPAYVPTVISSSMAPLSFLQRAQELWRQLLVLFFVELYAFKTDRGKYETLFGPIVAKRGNQLPLYEELKYNASLMFGNSHVSLGQAISLPQNYKAIGGYHIDPDIKPLPEDLKNLMDSSSNGVIYFSMGSNVKSQDFPDEVKQNLLDMFGQLKQTVIWKFEDTSLPNLPANVHIVKWAPQPSILSHPNCMLFITHGGLLSTTEAVHFGVPIVGVPVFADQFTNVERAVIRGYAKKVDLSYAIAKDLRAAIDEILNNKKYSQKVKELSSIYHDRVVPPRRELVHWVEHVIRTQGAPHLRSPALMVPWYQKLFLDLIFVIILILIAVTLVINRIISSLKSSGKKNKTH